MSTAQEQKQAEEAKYRRLVDDMNDGYMVVNWMGKIVFANGKLAEISGYKLKELIGENAAKLVPPENVPYSLKLAIRLEKRRRMRGQLGGVLLKKDGERVPVEISLKAIEYEGGPAIALVVRDITERKRAEEMLRDSEEMSRGMLESAATGIYIVQAGKFQYVSPMFEEISDYTSDELIGTYSLDYVHPEDREATRKKAIENLKGQSSSPHELRFMRKDGKPVWVLEKVASIQHKGERAAVGSFMNITERKRAEEALQCHTRRLEALHAVAQTVSQTLDLEEMLDSVVEKVKEAMEADAATISVVDERADGITVKAHRGLSLEYIATVGRLKLTPEELRGVMAWQGAIVTEGERLKWPKLVELGVATQKEGVQSSFAVPLLVKRFFLGAVAVAYRHPREFSQEDIDLLTAIANQVAVGVENSMLFAEMSHSATIDGLTGLYNHRYFQERLEEEVTRVVRFGGECSLIMLDLDHFKIYNDLFGHVAGDEVLKRVGQILRDHTRQVDIACRYGGEEFTVILPQTDSADAYQAAERVSYAIEQAFSQQGTSNGTHLTVSLGIASCPGDGLSREVLVRSADLAMREAKQRGRNQTCLASESAVADPVQGVARLEVAEHLEAASLNTIYALAAAVDARDHYTYSHSRNVAKYAVAIGKALGLSRRKQERLRIAALLHDIGKIGLSDSMIKKPGPLDEAEWEMMRKHSALGATIVSHTPELADCAPAIRYHHEWQDGSGYPDGLREEDIPLESRIIAIADAYDTMTTPRSYREMFSSEQALNELRRCANTQFDPKLVETFAQVIDSIVVGIA